MNVLILSFLCVIFLFQISPVFLLEMSIKFAHANCFPNTVSSSTQRVIAYIFMSIQNTLLDSAATDMANTFQKTYFSLLLHQDPTYFDLTDVAGAAGMISQNGAKFKKGVGRKLGEGKSSDILTEWL